MYRQPIAPRRSLPARVVDPGWSGGLSRACAALALMAVAAGCDIDPPRPDTANPQPQRIVSLDFCTDQYVLKFVEPDRILALSPDAGKAFSYMRDRAAGLPTVRPVTEDVIILRPDLVVRSYGGGPQAPAMFARAGVPVHNVGWAADLEAVIREIVDTAGMLGSSEQGLAVVADMRDRLAALRSRGPDANALYVTPGGVTTGPGSLIHEMLVVAGLDNFQTRPGWGPIPLERLAYERPDLVAVAFYETLANHPHAWSTIRHPVARALLDGGATVPLEGAWTACGAWFLMDAVEALARGPVADER